MASDEFYQPMVSHGWPLINVTDPSSVSIAEYRDWYSHHSSLVGANITDCSLEEEMNKVSSAELSKFSRFYLQQGYHDKNRIDQGNHKKYLKEWKHNVSKIAS